MYSASTAGRGYRAFVEVPVKDGAQNKSQGVVLDCRVRHARSKACSRKLVRSRRGPLAGSCTPGFTAADAIGSRRKSIDNSITVAVPKHRRMVTGLESRSHGNLHAQSRATTTPSQPDHSHSYQFLVSSSDDSLGAAAALFTGVGCHFSRIRESERGCRRVWRDDGGLMEGRERLGVGEVAYARLMVALLRRRDRRVVWRAARRA